VLRDVIETHFWRASRLALRLLPKVQDSELARRTLGLHIAAVLPAARNEASREIAAYYTFLGQVIAISEADPIIDVIPSRPHSDAELDDRALADLKAQLGSASASDIPGQPEAFRTAMSLWASELRALSQSISCVQASAAVNVPVEAILVDCVHMMMNRLGVPLPSECWIYRTIASLILDNSRLDNGA
jgi:hypothetical protein